METQQIIDQLYLNRGNLIKKTKNPYQSPNLIHRRIFWQRIFLADKLIARHIKHNNAVLDFGTHEGVIVPALVSRFNSVYSLELIEERNKPDDDGKTEKERLIEMVEFFKLPLEKLNYVDIEAEDQRLEMLDDNKFDCIVATDVLEHVPNLDILMNTFKRVLKDEGIMVISIPLEHFIYRSGVWLNNLFFKMGTERDFHINEAEDIDKILRDNFEVIETRTVFGFFRFYALKKRS